MTALNALLITIDSLRREHVGTYGYERATTPRINDIAEGGTVFTEAIANGPNTPSSFPSILTSSHATMHGGCRHLDSEQRPFISKALADSGLSTVGFHSNPHLGPERNYDVGFDTFNDSAEGSASVASFKDRIEGYLDPDSHLYSLLRRLWHYVSMSTDTAAYAKAETITSNAVDWLDDHDGDRCFMWLHYMDVHYPFRPPREFQDKIGVGPFSKRRIAELNGAMQENPESLSADDIEDLVALYDAEIRYTDNQIGRILDTLAGQNILEETAVVVTADHGEAFGEHDRFGHHQDLYDELLRVPLIIDAPEIPARTVEQQVSLLDIGPTLCECLGIAPPDGVQGNPLQPIVRNDERDDRIAIAMSGDGDHLACRTTKWKYFWRVEEDTVEVDDLKTDPTESVNVSADNPDICQQFREHLEAYRKEARASDTNQPDIEESAEIKQRLKDLGYVD